MKALFRQPSVLLPALTIIGLLVVLYLVAYDGFNRLSDAKQRVSVALERQVQLADYLRLMIDAETGQRGFLLTGNSRYLTPYDDAIPKLEPLTNSLAVSYARAGDDASFQTMHSIRALTAARLAELDSSVHTFRVEGGEAALAVLRTNVGIYTQDLIRQKVAELNSSESTAIKTATQVWTQDLKRTRLLSTFATALNIFLILLAAALLARALIRRAQQVQSLDLQLSERAAELSELTTYLQHVTELEKATLARELHDELGGLLVASKMDAVWLQRRLREADPDTQLRLRRISESMDEGVNFKRRVMENLRPTLLDNMGLFPALNWLLEETCARGNLNFQRVFPVSEPALSDEVRIAIFRVLQEAFTNVLAHAGATNIELRIATEVTQLLITIRDDGRGMDTSAKHVGAHGLINMRHRLGDIGGELEILSTPGHGTVLTARIPIGLQSGTAEPTGGS